MMLKIGAIIMPFSNPTCHLSSEQPKPLFWFWSDTETNLPIVSADTITDTETTNFRCSNKLT